MSVDESNQNLQASLEDNAIPCNDLSANKEVADKEETNMNETAGITRKQTDVKGSKDFGRFEIVHFDKPGFEKSYELLFEPRRELNQKRRSILKLKSATSLNSLTSDVEQDKVAADKTFNLFMELIPENNASQDIHTARIKAYDDDCHSTGTAQLSESSTSIGWQLEERRKFPIIGRFQVSKIEKTTEVIFKDFMQGSKYDVEFIRSHITLIADLVKTRIRHYFHFRYRLICLVHVFQINRQSIKFVSRSCLDVEKDSFVEYCYHGDGYTAVCTVYAVYLE